MNRRLLMKVFLGGTCSGSKWREKIIPKLKRTNIDYYNPIVPVWDKEAKQRERREKQEADYNIKVLRLHEQRLCRRNFFAVYLRT